MKRWHEDTAKMQQQRRVWHDSNRHSGDENPERFDKPMGKFRKKHALDCGKTDCFICHSDKLLNIKSKQEQLADLDKKEQCNGIDRN